MQKISLSSLLFLLCCILFDNAISLINTQFSRLAKVGSGIIVLAHEDFHNTSVEVGLRELWTKLDGFVEVLQCQIVFTCC